VLPKQREKSTIRSFILCFRYHEAETSIHDRNTRKQEVVESCLESDLELLGLTGVEDKLQDGVRNTLELMRNAGLRIWMLTGTVTIEIMNHP
jgi:P-type E1-E2 ATPase